jgi:hypothetical protein
MMAIKNALLSKNFLLFGKNSKVETQAPTDGARQI